MRLSFAPIRNPQKYVGFRTGPWNCRFVWTDALFCSLFAMNLSCKYCVRNPHARSQEEILVSEENFQEVFRDIGTACISLEECSWRETACPTKREGDAQTGDKEKDDDALFMRVIASLR